MSGTDARAARDAREARNEEFQRVRGEVVSELREIRRIRRALLDYDKKKDEAGTNDAAAEEAARAARIRLSRSEARYSTLAKGLRGTEREIFYRHGIIGESFEKIASERFYAKGSVKRIYTRALDRVVEKELAQ